MKSNRPLVIGHRGASGLEPENTLASFRRAIELGADGAECDIHISRDGRCMVIHDPTVERTTNGTGAVVEMDLAQLQRLDAGHGERIPTLDELLELIRGRCQLFCELKASGSAAPAAKVVAEHAMTEQVMFISLELEMLAEVRRQGEQFRIGGLFGYNHPLNWPALAAMRAEALLPFYRSVSLALVDAAHRAPGLADPGIPRLGAPLAVYPWTADQLPDMRAMLALGVDGVITNWPDVLMRELRLSNPGATK